MGELRIGAGTDGDGDIGDRDGDGVARLRDRAGGPVRADIPVAADLGDPGDRARIHIEDPGVVGGHRAAARALDRRGQRDLITPRGQWGFRLDGDRLGAGLIRDPRQGNGRRRSRGLGDLHQGHIPGQNRGRVQWKRELGRDRQLGGARGVAARGRCDGDHLQAGLLFRVQRRRFGARGVAVDVLGAGIDRRAGLQVGVDVVVAVFKGIVPVAGDFLAVEEEVHLADLVRGRDLGRQPHEVARLGSFRDDIAGEREDRRLLQPIGCDIGNNLESGDPCGDVRIAVIERDRPGRSDGVEDMEHLGGVGGVIDIKNAETAFALHLGRGASVGKQSEAAGTNGPGIDRLRSAFELDVAGIEGHTPPRRASGRVPGSDGLTQRALHRELGDLESRAGGRPGGKNIEIVARQGQVVDRKRRVVAPVEDRPGWNIEENDGRSKGRIAEVSGGFDYGCFRLQSDRVREDGRLRIRDIEDLDSALTRDQEVLPGEGDSGQLPRHGDRREQHRLRGRGGVKEPDCAGAVGRRRQIVVGVHRDRAFRERGALRMRRAGHAQYLQE